MVGISIGGEERQAPAGITIGEAVGAMGLHPDAYVYLIDGIPVPMDTLLAEGKAVKALRVASGG